MGTGNLHTVPEEVLIFSNTDEAFFQRALGSKLTPKVVEEVRQVGINLDKPFLPAYPFDVWVKALEVTAKELYPTVSRREAFFELGTTIDYGFHMIVTDMPDERLPEMRRLADEGVTSYKLFMAYPGVLYVDDGTLYRAFRQSGENGTRICMHAENGIVIDEIIKSALKEGKTSPRWHAQTRPTRMEAEGVHRAISIAEVAKVPLYIVHLSCSDALEEVKRGRARGVDVVAETCPQYLFLDETYYDRDGFEGAKWVMTPALREKWNQDALWQGLRFRDLETIATDHCPFCM